MQHISDQQWQTCLVTAKMFFIEKPAIHERTLFIITAM